MDLNETNIDAIVFDVGGVLLRTTDPEPRAQINAEFDLGEAGIENLVFSSTQGQAAQLGHITERQLWESIGQQLDLDGDISDLHSKFWAGDSIDTEITQWLKLVREKTEIKTAIISNYADNLIPDLEDRYQIAYLFQHITVSCVEGILKPDPKIYLDTLSSINAAPSSTVFIDDTLENVEAAKELGMIALHFRPETTLAKLKELVSV